MSPECMACAQDTPSAHQDAGSRRVLKTYDGKLSNVLPFVREVEESHRTAMEAANALNRVGVLQEASVVALADHFAALQEELTVALPSLADMVIRRAARRDALIDAMDLIDMAAQCLGDGDGGAAASYFLDQLSKPRSLLDPEWVAILADSADFWLEWELVPALQEIAEGFDLDKATDANYSARKGARP